MTQEVIKQLKIKHKSSGGHCGVLIYDFNIPLIELKPILNDLYKQNKISVHDNHKGKLIKLKL
jgi:hypothetical protein